MNEDKQSKPCIEKTTQCKACFVYVPGKFGWGFLSNVQKIVFRVGLKMRKFIIKNNYGLLFYLIKIKKILHKINR